MGNLLKPNIKVFGQARVVRKLKKNLPLATKMACRGACMETAGRLRTLIRNLAPELRQLPQLTTHRWLEKGYLKNSIMMTPVSVRDGTGYVIGSVAPYACTIGGKFGVYSPSTGTAEDISFFNLPDVLSKDGKAHKVLRRLSFPTMEQREIRGIEIQIDKRRKLRVTPDHLILAIREGNLEWINADKLKLSDYIFRKRAHNSKEKIALICPCGKEFRIKPWELGREPKYCSHSCRHKYGSHNMARGKTWKLTEEQKKRVQGENNPAWKGGIGREPYDWRFNRALKKKVLERDDYMCQICSPKEKREGRKGRLHVHHKNFDKRDSRIENLITLCISCHAKVGWGSLACELPEVNLKVFRPKHPKAIRKFIRVKRGKTNFNKLRLYDLEIEGENSFVVSGILVHNSHVEYGVSHPGVPLGTKVYFWSQKEGMFRVTEGGIKPHSIKAQPFFRPALGWGEKQLYYSSGSWWRRELRRYLKGG